MADLPLKSLPFLGFGLGLRSPHYETILEEKPDVDWFEILSENYLVPGGQPLFYAEKIRALYPMVMHGVSLSLGSTDPLNWDYLKAIRDLRDRLQPAWLSDHLCWTGVHGYNSHDLLPLPYTEEALHHVASRILQVQDFLGHQILIENPSSYVSFAHSQMTEWEFLAQLAESSDCLLLLDVNNVYVSSVNHAFDPKIYIQSLDPTRIIQIHLAGHHVYPDYIIDSHDAPVSDPVWDLYEWTTQKFKAFGPISTMIERDDNIPEMSVLLQELEQIKRKCHSLPTPVSQVICV